MAVPIWCLHTQSQQEASALYGRPLQFLKDNNENEKDEELQRIADNVRLVGGESDFATLYKVYRWMIKGLPAVDKDGRLTTVYLIDFDEPDNNILGWSTSLL